MKKIREFMVNHKSKFKEIILYVLSSLGSTAFDWLIYLLMINVFGVGVQISYSVGKVSSGIVNFMLNNFLVFHQGGGIGLLKRGAGYCLTVGVSLVAGNLLVTLMSMAGIGEELAKLIADSICFFVNYFIQSNVVFNHK